jgi:hypothetical protein
MYQYSFSLWVKDDITVRCTLVVCSIRVKDGRTGDVPIFLQGIVSPDWKGLQMVSLDRF